MSPITFESFNKACCLIDPNTLNGLPYVSYLFCIQNIKSSFRYPQFYNGLIAHLLLFNSDVSYTLTDNRVRHIFEDAKELVTEGYEEFGQTKSLGINNINQLIYSLCKMSDICLQQNPQLRSESLKAFEKSTLEMKSQRNKEGLPFSEHSAMGIKAAEEQTIMIDPTRFESFFTSYTTSEEDWTMNTLSNFEERWNSIRDGFVLSCSIGTFRDYFFKLMLDFLLMFIVAKYGTKYMHSLFQI